MDKIINHELVEAKTFNTKLDQAPKSFINQEKPTSEIEDVIEQARRLVSVL